MKKYDVIIVGCGPAGVAAAKVLKENNINYCVIEKNKFPREKLCGGGLTHKSLVLLEQLGFNLNNITTKEFKEIDIVAKNINSKLDLTNKIIMIDRFEFDYNNIKQVDDININYEENIINIENDTLITDKDKYEFKYIIFADGVNGYSRKLISDRKYGFCVECNSNTKYDKTIFNFNAINEGYGWVFPKENHTTIGIGKFNNKKDDFQKLLLDFSNKYNLDIDKNKIRGYFLPIFSKKVYKKSVIDNKYILVGDAASLVDSVSGEGIYYALSSGLCAAKSIISSINNKKDLRKEYFKNTKRLYKDLKFRVFLSKFLYSKHGSFYIKISLKSKYIMKYLNKILG